MQYDEIDTERLYYVIFLDYTKFEIL